MVSKTPQFDKALDEYFMRLELDDKGGQEKTCRLSGEKFYVRPEDIEFYKRMRVPLPTLSPRERMRRLIAFYNNYNLFMGTSAHSGKQIISSYPPSTPFKIYEHQFWFSNEWRPEDYGPEHDPAIPFFVQFRNLQLAVPRPNLRVDKTNVNSEYTNASGYLRNCYLVFDSWQVEDSAYSLGLFNSRGCYDSFSLFNCDTCHECFESSHLWHCFFVEYSKYCRDSWFLYDCRDCEYCFGSTNLRHKKYYFFNTPLNKEAYEERLKSLDLGNREVIEEIKQKLRDLKQKAIFKETRNERAIASLGDYIKDSRNCHACFYATGSENLAYCLGSIKNRESYDLFGGIETEASYESRGGSKNYGIKFSLAVESCREVEYCELCTNCHDCFGCIGLNHKSFCIFNRQYPEEEYWQTVGEIKTKMLRDGEYGEFFPPDLAPVPYNISTATSYLGYDDIDMARKYGYNMEDVGGSMYEISGETIKSEDVSKHIQDVKDDILQKIVVDTEYGKKFRYIRPELEFCRRFNIPLPIHHPSERMAEKRKRFGSILYELFERPCLKCGRIMQTTYAPDRPEIVYCEGCYQQEVI